MTFSLITGNAFKNNDLDIAEIRNHANIGQIEKIEIKSDDSGIGSVWYLSNIIVKVGFNDAKTFYYNDWIKDEKTKTLSL